MNLIREKPDAEMKEVFERLFHAIAVLFPLSAVY
jgi:hypothetical protein